MSAAHLDQLITVSEDILLAPANRTTEDEDSPKLVVLFGWMGAQLPHLRKYIALHHKQFPSTPVLLVRSHPGLFIKPQRMRLHSFRPILPHLPSSDILFHVISNGGGLRFVDLLNLREISPHSHCAILFDSAPGALQLGTTLRAYLVPFKNPFVRLLGRLIITPFYYLMKLPDILLRRGNSFDRIREPLNDLDKVDYDLPRAYIYSKEDMLVQDWAVEAHAAQAKKKGYRVTLYRFHGSGHAGHLRMAPERYGEVVRELWGMVQRE